LHFSLAGSFWASLIWAPGVTDLPLRTEERKPLQHPSAACPGQRATVRKGATSEAPLSPHTVLWGSGHTPPVVIKISCARKSVEINPSANGVLTDSVIILFLFFLCGLLPGCRAAVRYVRYDCDPCVCSFHFLRLSRWSKVFPIQFPCAPVIAGRADDLTRMQQTAGFEIVSVATGCSSLPRRRFLQ